MNSRRREVRLTSTGIAVLLSALTASSGSAQPQVDTRFQPWMGCWAPTVLSAGTGGTQTAKAPSLACVVPSQSIRGSVDIVVFDSANVSTRAAIPLPGTTVAKSVDGCSGTETARWTPDDMRLVMMAELSCGRGAKRKEAGLLTMTPSGEWLQVQHLAVGGNSATTVLTMRYVAESLGEWARLGAGAVASTASLRLAVGAPLVNSDVLAVATLAPAPLVEAWLTESGQRFTLTGKELLRLADRGMPPRVIDLMVAMSNPETFAVRAVGDERRWSGDVGARAGDLITGGIGNARLRGTCSTFDDLCYGPGGMGAWGLGWQYGLNAFDPWSLRYGMGGPFNAFGNQFGNGFGAGFGNGFYFGNAPIIIVDRAAGQPAGAAPIVGRAVRGGGYTRRPVGAQPREPVGGGASPSPRAGASGGSSGDAGGAGSAGGASSSGGGTGRTAKPRGGGR